MTINSNSKGSMLTFLTIICDVILATTLRVKFVIRLWMLVTIDPLNMVQIVIRSMGMSIELRLYIL